MAKIIIDAKGAVFGRLCSFAAKKALQGDEIIIINSEKSIISGNKRNTVEKYLRLRKKGSGGSLKGPKPSKISYMMLKKGIRGMLPDFRRGIGKIAFSKIRCYDGIPKEFENEKTVKSGKTKPKKFITLKELSKEL